jgi:hypothetical protein
MKIETDYLYILIEGEPNSPEVAFINRVISNLITQQILPDINYDVIEVGGGGNFNSIAKIIYRESRIHQRIPVLAISDNDFRIQSRINVINNTCDENLIRDKKVRLLYWQRHEWENFLLEETAMIAYLLNSIPPQSPNLKPIKRNTTDTLTKQQLDTWLIEYFQNSIVEELVECLRFRFRERANLRLSLDKLANEKLNNLSLAEIEVWFRQQIATKAQESETSILNLQSMLNEKLQESLWQSCLNQPISLELNQAKTLFRGKEALQSIFGNAINYLSIQNLNYQTFLQEILLPELEKNINSPIVQQINLLLHPYFQNIANLPTEY